MFPVIAGSVTLTVVTPFVSIASITRSVPTGAAAGQHRRHKKNGQENQQRFSHCLAPFGLFLKLEREVPLLILHWNEGGAQIIQCMIDNKWAGRSGTKPRRFLVYWGVGARFDGKSDRNANSAQTTPIFGF